MNTTTNTKGFTIIEVVLVLAIAALIFLMVFIAFPALSRGQANTARKNDMSTVAAAVNTYRTNNNGRLPTTYAQLTSYVDELSQITFPTSGNLLDGAGQTIDASEDTLDTLIVVVQAKCDGDTTQSGTAKQAAVLAVVQTSGSQYTTVCQNV